MTASNLIKKVKIDFEEILGIEPVKLDTCLIFGIRSNYIPYLKVMIQSIIQVGELVDIPIVIVTDDPLVTSDAFIKCIADEVYVIEGAVKELIGLGMSSIQDRDGVRNEVATFGEWTAGTMLKWASFRDWGTQTALFLDADMIVTGPMIDLYTAPHARNAIVGVTQFSRRMVRDEDGNRRRNGVILSFLNELIDHGTSVFNRSLNSGVMLIEKDLLDISFLDHLVRFASERKNTFRNEQAVISAFLEHSESYAIEFAPAKFNYHEEFLNAFSVRHQIQLLERISIVHYAGPIKPWGNPIHDGNRVAQMLWHRMNHEMKMEFKKLR